MDRIGRLQGKSTRYGVMKCYDCRKPFTVRVGTIFEDRPRQAASVAAGDLSGGGEQEGIARTSCTALSA